MGRPKNSKDKKPRVRLQTLKEVIKPELLERVSLTKRVFYEVTIRQNGESRSHYFDEQGEEYVQRTLLTSVRKKEHFEAGLRKPIERGGEENNGTNKETDE